MNKEQQIEELTKLIQTKEISHCDDDMHCEDCYCGCKGMAEMIYNAGYRKGETVSYQAMIDHSYIDRINQLEHRLAEARKETAKEILQEWADDNSSMGIDNTFVKHIAKKYGVEVEE